MERRIDDVRPQTGLEWDAKSEAMDRAGELPLERQVALDALASQPAAPVAPVGMTEREGFIWSRGYLAGRELAAPVTAAPSNELTDAYAHSLMLEMQEHVQEWADKQDLDVHEDDDHPAFSGECMRFLQRRLSAAPPVQQPGDVRAESDLTTTDCPVCEGKGGWATAEWTDPVSGPECEGEVCEECSGVGKIIVSKAAQQALATTRPSAALTDADYQEILRPVLSRKGMQCYLNGDAVELDPSDYRAIINRAILAASGGALAVPEGDAA